MNGLYPENIQQVFTELREAYSDMFDAAHSESLIRTNLKRLEMEALADGQIEGKNVAEREANALKLFAKQHVALQDAAVIKAQCTKKYELVKINYDEIKILLRVAELDLHGHV